jgi:hypothetical protein
MDLDWLTHGLKANTLPIIVGEYHHSSTIERRHPFGRVCCRTSTTINTSGTTGRTLQRPYLVRMRASVPREWQRNARCTLSQLSMAITYYTHSTTCLKIRDGQTVWVDYPLLVRPPVLVPGYHAGLVGRIQVKRLPG